MGCSQQDPPRIPTTCLHRAETKRTAALHRGEQDPRETGDGDGMHRTPAPITRPQSRRCSEFSWTNAFAMRDSLALAGDHQNGPAAVLIAGSETPPEKEEKSTGKNIDSGGWHVSSPSVSALRSAAAERREAERAAGYL